MARDFQIYGPAMVSVNFGSHIPPASGAIVSTSRRYDLGLTLDPVRIAVSFNHQEVRTDSYGPTVPVDSQWMYADVQITTRLVHWDLAVMELCLQEAAAGGGFPGLPGTDGSFALAGTPMGAGIAPAVIGRPFAPGAGYHYISLNIRPSLPSQPWRFPASYLTEQPVVLPLGTEKSVVELTWRAVPYNMAKEATVSTSGGAIRWQVAEASPDASFPTSPVFLWDHISDI